MLTNTMEITNSLYEELRSNSTLSGCNVVFSKGYPDISRSRFPFISIDYPSYVEKQITAASGIFTYSFQVYIGTKSLDPIVALKGIDGGKSGVAELCEKVRSIISNNTLDGAFFSVPYNIDIDPQLINSSGGTVIVGSVEFSVDVWFFHAT